MNRHADLLLPLKETNFVNVCFKNNSRIFCKKTQVASDIPYTIYHILQAWGSSGSLWIIYVCLSRLSLTCIYGISVLSSPPTGSNYVYMKIYVTVFAFLYYTISPQSLENNKLSFYSLDSSAISFLALFLSLRSALGAKFIEYSICCLRYSLYLWRVPNSAYPLVFNWPTQRIRHRVCLFGLVPSIRQAICMLYQIPSLYTINWGSVRESTVYTLELSLSLSHILSFALQRACA